MPDRYYILTGAVFAFLLVACTTLPGTGERTLYTDADTGVVAFYAPPSNAGLTLAIGRYDAEDQSIDERFNAGYDLDIPRSGERRLIAKTIRAGTYAVARSERATFWQLCHHASTPVIEVKPGVVTFLGDLDTATLHASIEGKAAADGDTDLRMSAVTPETRLYFGGVPAPRFSFPASPAGADRMRQSLQADLQTFPGDLNAPTRFVSTSAGRFGVSTEPFSDRMTCTGPVRYNNSKMKPARR